MERQPRDWREWHRAYDDPDSRLSRRLRIVQAHLRAAIDERPGRIRIVSMCAGQGRDVIGVLAEHPRASDATAVLVELEPSLADQAREAARAAGLTGVEVRTADAALTESYAGAVPAEIVLACGIFGNITMEDIRRTIDRLPELCAPGATVIWTRGGKRDHDLAPEICARFEARGFDRIAFDSSPDADHFRVGVHRLRADPRPLSPGERLFTFVRMPLLQLPQHEAPGRGSADHTGA
jgi:hypothetical protein